MEKSSFRLWIEYQDTKIGSRRQNYFDQVMQILQATRDDLSKPLTNLPSVRSPKPQDGEAQPPQNGQGVLTKIQNLLNNVLQQMSSDRSDTESSIRANRTMELLRTRSNDSVVKPVMYLQDLLKELFGTNFYQDYINQSQSQDDTEMPLPNKKAPIQSAPNPMPDFNSPASQVDQQFLQPNQTV